MINLDLGGNGDTHAVTDDVVNDAIETLDNPDQKVENIYLILGNNFFKKGSCFAMSRS
jgi:hypothetical protein